MSRIGKVPVPVPAGVTVTLNGNQITVKGPKGELSRTLPADISLAYADNVITLSRPSEETRHKSLHGLSRTLVANMVVGVS
jgi:large subunit ribosomal protein L6